MMIRIVKYVIIVAALLVIGIFLLGYLSSFVGWYGYKKWRYRVLTSTIAESKNRNVFVRKLSYQILDFGDSLDNFEAYIEKGFRFGYHSSEETRQITNSRYPYQLSFTAHPRQNISINIIQDNLTKFDSSNSSWGFLKDSVLKDTIELEIHEQGVHPGKIKVWQPKS